MAAAAGGHFRGAEFFKADVANHVFRRRSLHRWSHSSGEPFVAGGVEVPTVGEEEGAGEASGDGEGGGDGGDVAFLEVFYIRFFIFYSL